jgi:hypothetical protein
MERCAPGAAAPALSALNPSGDEAPPIAVGAERAKAPMCEDAGVDGGAHVD